MGLDIVERLRNYSYEPEFAEAADTIESLRARVAELESEADPEALHIAYLHGQADRDQRLTAKDQRIAELEEQLENEQARGIHSCHPGCLRDGCVNRRLRDQLAAKALTIKTMRTVLENFIDSHEECTDFDGFTAQVVSMDDYHEAQDAIALPDNSTEVLQEWLDGQFGEPVASIVEMSIAGVPTTKGIDWLSAPKLGEKLYRKPEIK